MDPAPAALHWVRSGVDQIFLGQRDHVERGLSDYRILGLQARHTVGGLLVKCFAALVVRVRSSFTV